MNKRLQLDRGSEPPTGMQIAEVAALIRQLHTLKGASQHKVRLAAWPEKLEGFAMWPLSSAAICFLFLLVAAGLQTANWLVVPKTAVLLIATLSNLLALVAVLLQTIGGAFGFWLEQRNGGLIMAWRCERDLVFAVGLSKHAALSVELADRWLEQEVKRIEARLSLFFGGVDKVALFALVGIGWAATKEVAGGFLALHPLPTWCAMAFLVGLALGGLASRVSLQRLSYHRELISLSKTVRESTEARGV
jgi:hypothetical protein